MGKILARVLLRVARLLGLSVLEELPTSERPPPPSPCPDEEIPVTLSSSPRAITPRPPPLPSSKPPPKR
jgi:hypothetical protein